MDHKINYLLGSWSGHRIHIPNPGDYLRRHIDKLNSIQHNLAQVSIGCPDNPEMSTEYRNYVNSLKSLDDGTPIVVYHMPNKGLSYGQYSYMFEECQNQFSHFIFMEDDYLPVADNFDFILSDWFDELYVSENCGYLCSLMFQPNNSYNKHCKFTHAAVSNGISNNEVLNVIWNKFGCLPNQTISTDRPEQIVFSQGFTNCGYKICDTIEKYRCIYFQSVQNSLWLFGNKDDDDLISPVQYFDEENLKLFMLDDQVIKPQANDDQVIKSQKSQTNEQIIKIDRKSSRGKSRRLGVGRRSGKGA